MQTWWWPSPLLGHCVSADPKGCLRCRYFSFASDLMWPSPCMISSHGFVPLPHIRKSCPQVCFHFHFTPKHLGGSISTLHIWVLLIPACISQMKGIFFLIQLEFRIHLEISNFKLLKLHICTGKMITEMCSGSTNFTQWIVSHLLFPLFLSFSLSAFLTDACSVDCYCWWL